MGVGFNTGLPANLNKAFGLQGLMIFQCFNPSTAKLFNLNFHPLEVVSR